jgi:hypothetical protein
LSAGTYANVDAVFTPATASSSDGSITYTTSTSTPPQSFTVNPESEGTITTLNTVTSPVTYGSETAETFTGTVTGASGDGYPEGTVTLYYTTTPVQMCAETLPAGSGDTATFSCPLTASQLSAATYGNVVAVFTPGTASSSSNGDFTYTTSTSTPAQSFTVNPESEGTITTLNTVTSPITFGSENAETFTGTVTGQSGDGAPGGTVTIYYGTTPVALCNDSLPSAGSGDSATFSCPLAASQLVPATYGSVDAVYGGGGSLNNDYTYTTSTSTPTQSFTVNGESEGTTTTLNTVTSPITFGSETAETFTGTVTGASGDGYPEGTVTIYYGTTPVAICNETLPAGSGDSASYSCPLTASQLPPATYSSVDAVFTPGTASSSSNGDFTYTTSTSTPTQSFTVNPSVSTVGTTTTLNTVTSPITYGSETAETFTGTVTGASGDGFPIGTVTVYYGTTPVALCHENLPSTGSGDSATFTCPLTASQLSAGTYANVDAVFTPATASSSDGSITYTTSTSTPPQSFTVNPAVSSSNNLQIQMSSSGLIAGVGGLYLVTVTNHASTASTGTLTITDVLPAGVSYGGDLVYPPGWHCTSVSGTVTCTSSAAIAPHGVDYLLLAVGVSARSGTSITNTVKLTPVGTPASNYTATVTTKVAPR